MVAGGLGSVGEESTSANGGSIVIEEGYSWIVDPVDGGSRYISPQMGDGLEADVRDSLGTTK